MRRFALLRPDGRASRLLSFDHEPASNQLPGPDDGQLIGISDEQYADWVANMDTRAWIDGGLQVVASIAVYLVPTATIVARLSAVGKLRAARMAMKFDAPLNQITDAELELQELWRANAAIHSDYPAAWAMLSSLNLASVGSSPAAILARP